MRKLLLFTTLVFAFVNANSQAIGIGTTSPSSSSLLDISSTTKGMLMPRMTSAQRAAISSPASGLMVFDTDTKTLWAYDGTVWKNLYTSGGVLILPFSQTVNTAISAFQVTNQGIGAAIEGSSTAQFGIGMTAKTTGEGGWGLFAFSNGAGSQSIRSYADNGTAFHGENNNAANTNTLMNLLNKGAGKTGSFQLTNNSSTSPNVQVAGNHLGEQIKVYQTNASNSLPAISIENSGTGEGLKSVSANNATGILGVSSTGYGIKGESTTASGFGGVRGDNFGAAGSGVIGSSNAANTQGVYGTSTNGIGVRGLSTTYRGIQGVSTSGTGVYASSTSGLALETVGNIKISGGNTNPSEGAVLTSDANGNATWKGGKIAFRGYGTNVSLSYPSGNWWKVYFANELYDFGNDFTAFAGNVPPAGASEFTVPVNGVYSFASNLFVLINGEGLDVDELSQADIRIGITRGGNTSYTETIPAYNIDHIDSSPSQFLIDLKITSELYLLAGDKVFVQFRHSNDDNQNAIVANYDYLTYFHGRLVVAD
jgi:hypothetical protein